MNIQINEKRLKERITEIMESTIWERFPGVSHDSKMKMSLDAALKEEIGKSVMEQIGDELRPKNPGKQ